MHTAVEKYINAYYNAGPFSIEKQFTTSGQRLAYQISSPTGRWVVKLTDPDRLEEVVHADVHTPAYLAGKNFPVPRPLPAKDGRLYLPYEDRFLYIYEYIPGESPHPSDRFFSNLGMLLGRLHNLPAGSVPESAYRPEPVLSGVREAVLRVAQSPQVPDDQRAVIPEILRLIDDFPSFDGIPLGIIHTDPYLVNLIEAPSGELSLIDWEDGGISYPLLDVGYVLAFVCTFTARDRRLWGVPGPAEGISHRPDWGEIFMNAYESVRPLTSIERNRLPDAIRFSFLEYLPMWGKNEVILDNYRRMQMVLGS